MPTSVLLIRWNGGWHEYVDLAAEVEFGRSEAFLSLGAVQSVSEARRLAKAELEKLNARWKEEKELVDRLLALRAKLRGGNKPVDVSSPPPPEEGQGGGRFRTS